jgi:hypothetical protein
MLLRYPLQNIKPGIDYLDIQIVETVKVSPRTVSVGQTGGNIQILLKDPGFARNKTLKSPIASIILPMPSNITDSNQVTYSDDTLDAVTAQLAGFAGSLMTTDFGSDNIPTQIANKFTAFTENVGNDSSDLKKIFIGKLAAEAAQIPGVGNITLNQILARGENQILNPNMELLFSGPTIRNFKFSFKMTPRDESESKEVKNIIRTFKQNMAPQTNNNYFLQSPNIFELRYMQTNNPKGKPEPHQFLHKFKQCALTDMTVNYTGENIYATYADGTPVSMIMDLTFKELEPIYSSDYTETSEGQIGVGY